jgi:hypothetical protein
MQSFDINDLLKKLKGLDQRKSDDAIYAQIYDEFSSGIMDKVAQARAIADSDGNEEKIKSEYIKNRFIRIKDELAELQWSEAEHEKQREHALKNLRAKDLVAKASTTLILIAMIIALAIVWGVGVIAMNLL